MENEMKVSDLHPSAKTNYVAYFQHFTTIATNIEYRKREFANSIIQDPHVR